MDSRDILIATFHRMGMNYVDMTYALARNGFIISLRHLKRQLLRLGLSRRTYADIGDVLMFVKNELKNSGRLHGYRWMWQKCLNHGLNVPRRYIQIIMSAVDPDGSAFR